MRKGGPDTRRFPLQLCKLPRGPGPQHLLPQPETNPSLHPRRGKRGKGIFNQHLQLSTPIGRPGEQFFTMLGARSAQAREGATLCGSRAGKKLPPGVINYVNIPSTALCPQRVAAAFPIGGERRCVVEKYSKCHERSGRPKPHACGSGPQPPLRVKWRFDKRGADPEPVPSSIRCGRSTPSPGREGVREPRGQGQSACLHVPPPLAVRVQTEGQLSQGRHFEGWQ